MPPSDVTQALRVDVDAAIERGKTCTWNAERSHVDNEAAYWDRTLLGTEVERMREELAAALEALDEAEREVETLHQALLEPDDD
jgi:hypothetical protein